MRSWDGGAVVSGWVVWVESTRVVVVSEVATAAVVDVAGAAVVLAGVAVSLTGMRASSDLSPHAVSVSARASAVTPVPIVVVGAWGSQRMVIPATVRNC